MLQTWRSAAPASPYPVGRKVRLREIEAVDRRTLAGFDRDLAGSAGAAGYRHWAAHRGDGDLRFAIETLRGGMVVGSISAGPVDSRSGWFSYGIGIGEPHRRCGYASDAITVLLAYMFGRGYRKCEVSVYGGNVASLALHGTLGFREEGRLRDVEMRRGEIRYVVRMGITAVEFAGLHPDFIAPGGPDLPRRGRHWRPRGGRHRLADAL
ncbi:GNAT family N-acetyltransferase [Amycolatopsis suaedae]|uniref:N-acetyltransferase n=1 Tax=Amycolatopsis suaedae TaxID=2510978 RepID=A0A4Q7J8T3_9PSEU|nr:GNAT family protein [Amycolatopsis suaedae]RZQ63272.1 N-acetyltransferase [Amycolatopsis suaedae]